MKKIKKILAVFLSVIFSIMIFQVPGSSTKAETTDDGSESVYVKIRYNRPDKNYDGWNIWVWEEGKEGRQADFIGEDSEGKFAVVKTSKNAGSLGYILRQKIAGNDWGKNYFGTDKSIDVTDGDKEIIINDGETTEKVEKLNKEFDKVTLNLHYYRFNNDYDEWDTWAWMDSSVKDQPISEGKGYKFTETDSFGKVAKIEMNNVKNSDNRKVSEKGIGIIVRKPDWSQKDGNNDRYVNLAYANKDGVIDAYIVQGNENIVYSEDDIVRNPSIIRAVINSSNEIEFSSNVKLTEDVLKDVVVKEDGKALSGLATISTSSSSAKITTSSKLDLSKEYTLEVKGYDSKLITLGKVLESKNFSEQYTYNGELGALYSKDKTTFILWAPIASQVKLALYDAGNDCDAKEVKTMTKSENGTWKITLDGDLRGTYYNYLVTNYNEENEVTDPYAKAVGVNGNRGMVVDLNSTNPEGWDKDTKPELKDPTDSIIYEMHIRDLTQDASSGASLEVRGKYKGVWQSGTRLFGKGDVKTGIDHLKELGVTHVHILPTFDYNTVDETRLDEPQFNWGYDPQNYNVPEGSYSSNPYKAEVRIREFKEMVQELHKAGIRVVMDMVYNHTSLSENSTLNKAVPNYYYRQDANGNFSNGSGCGNETASERSMVRKLILDSVLYWANEYHIDGFRFDLMAVHDIDTMKIIRSELDKIDPRILVYGEGWNGGDSSLPDDKKALKANMPKFEKLQIAAFSDDMRDGIKGHVFEPETPGFINGFKGLEEVIKFGIAASTKQNEISYKGGPAQYSGYGKEAWANEPYQTINYTSAHDNLTLWDKLQTTNPKASKEELTAMNKMAAALVLTSQGIPFFQAGEEIARTKVKDDGTFDENSYKSPDSVNSIKWNRKVEYKDLYDYYKGLIELRKGHKIFRMNTTEDIKNNLKFLEKGKNFSEDNVVAYTLNGKELNDEWQRAAVIFNGNDKDVKVVLPEGNWSVVVNGEKAGTEAIDTIEGNEITVKAKSSYVLVGSESFKKEDTSTEKNNQGLEEETKGEEFTKDNTNNSNKSANLAKGSSVKTNDVNLGLYMFISLCALIGICFGLKKKVSL